MAKRYQLAEAGREIDRLEKVNADLLAALEALYEYHYRGDYIGLAKDYQDKARAAIDKARGQ